MPFEISWLHETLLIRLPAFDAAQ